MLLRRQVDRGVDILSVRGPISDADAPALLNAIADAAALHPRGVVLDLSDADQLSPQALEAVRQARAAGPGWPRPAFLVCCSSEEVAAALNDFLPVHARLEDGLAHVDDRSDAPRLRVELDSSPLSPARARAVTADVVADHDLGSIGDDLALVVSELVTNAVRYGQAPVALEIETGEQTVTVAVGDGTPGRPTPRDVPEDAEGGRGLTLIDLLAAETGVRPSPPGKTVWAELDRP